MFHDIFDASLNESQYLFRIYMSGELLYCLERARPIEFGVVVHEINAKRINMNYNSKKIEILVEQ